MFAANFFTTSPDETFNKRDIANFISMSNIYSRSNPENSKLLNKAINDNFYLGNYVAKDYYYYRSKGNEKEPPAYSEAGTVPLEPPPVLAAIEIENGNEFIRRTTQFGQAGRKWKMAFRMRWRDRVEGRALQGTTKTIKET